MKYEAPPPDRFEVNSTDPNGGASIRTFCLILLFIFVVLFFAIQGIQYLTLKWISRDYERQLMSSTKVDKIFKSQKSEILTDFVKKITKLDYPIEIAILDSKELNAYCTFGDRIFVTKKLLQTVETENELAFVLAHEAGHSFHRHNTKGLVFNLVYNLTLGALGLGSQSLVSGTNTYSRDLENQADEFAIQALNRYYGHTNGAEDFFKRIGSDQIHFSWWIKLMEKVFSTHPSSDQRIRKIIGSSLGEKTMRPISKSESKLLKSLSETHKESL